MTRVDARRVPRRKTEDYFETATRYSELAARIRGSNGRKVRLRPLRGLRRDSLRPTASARPGSMRKSLPSRSSRWFRRAKEKLEESAVCLVGQSRRRRSAFAAAPLRRDSLRPTASARPGSMRKSLPSRSSRWFRRAKAGWEAGIRTPITASRARCPTVERPPSSGRILQAGTFSLPESDPTGQIAAAALSRTANGARLDAGCREA
jgi:hypothetical protein